MYLQPAETCEEHTRHTETHNERGKHLHIKEAMLCSLKQRDTQVEMNTWHPLASAQYFMTCLLCCFIHKFNTTLQTFFNIPLYSSHSIQCLNSRRLQSHSQGLCPSSRCCRLARGSNAALSKPRSRLPARDSHLWDNRLKSNVNSLF